MDRKRLIGIGRWTLTAVVLAVILPRAHFDELRVSWTRSTIAWISASFLVTFVAVVLSAVRWQRVLAGLELTARLPTLLSHHLACLFVSSFLPSTVGGDVLRVSRLSAANGERPRTFASVVLERLTGWIVLPVITLAGLAINPGLWREDRASRVAVFIAVTTLVLLSALLWAAANPRIGGRLATREGWTRFLGAVHLGVDRFRRHPGLALEVLISGFAYQLAIVLAAYLASRALGLDPQVGLTAIIAFMPAVAIVQVLPFPTVGGLGVREGAFVLFLRPLGVPQSQAIALGLLVYAITLGVSLLGAPAFAAGNRHGASGVGVLRETGALRTD